jgi:uncharacterized protein (DUF2237 family)
MESGTGVPPNSRRVDPCCFPRPRSFSKTRGNDLSTPMPEMGFPALKPGDRWCLSATRWKEPLDAGMAPRVVLRATHKEALEYVSLADFRRHALDLA